MGTSRVDYLTAFELELETFADKIKPELIMISAGFDAHEQDPVGSLGLETEDFATMSKAVINVANNHCKGRIVSVLEGGYNVPILAGCVAEHLDHLDR